MLAWLSLAPADPALYPPRGTVRVPVLVVDHGYHSGLVVRAIDLRAIAAAPGAEHPGPGRRLMSLAERWPGADWFEFGWGDAAFYQATPRLADLDLGLAIPALLWPTESVVQVVPGVGPLDGAFAGSNRVTLALTAEGWWALAIRLGESVAPGPSEAGAPEPVGPSLYGAGHFFPSPISYHAGRTCNQWVSWLLRVAGVPSSWFWSITSAGLVGELRLRAVRLCRFRRGMGYIETPYPMDWNDSGISAASRLTTTPPWVIWAPHRPGMTRPVEFPRPTAAR